MQHFILAVTKHLPSRPGSSSSSSTTADATDASAMETDSLLQSTDEQPSAYANESEVQSLTLYTIAYTTIIMHVYSFVWHCHMRTAR
jgi:hypothetical protein